MPTMTTTLSGTGESLHDAPGPRPEQRAVITPVAIVRLSGLRGRTGGELAMGRSGGHHRPASQGSQKAIQVSRPGGCSDVSCSPSSGPAGRREGQHHKEGC